MSGTKPNLLSAMENVAHWESLAVSVTFEIGASDGTELPGCEPMTCIGRIFNAAGEEVFRVHQDATGAYRDAMLYVLDQITKQWTVNRSL